MIRKSVIKDVPKVSEWMDLATLARLEISSEDPQHPIEFALNEDGKFWRAAEDGEQTVRVLFDAPQNISRISLLFQENTVSRTQQFSLLWQGPSKASVELVRQQFNFGPPGTTEEREDYKFSLQQVEILELVIKPDIGKPARASLTHLLVQ